MGTPYREAFILYASTCTHIRSLGILAIKTNCGVVDITVRLCLHMVGFCCLSKKQFAVDCFLKAFEGG